MKDLAKIVDGKPVDIPKAFNWAAIVLSLDLLARSKKKYFLHDLGNLALTFDVKDENLVVYRAYELIDTLKRELENPFFRDPKKAE